MKIYINDNCEIKSIHTTSDTSLGEIEVDREKVFGDMSDFMILHYKYMPQEYGYFISPAIEYDKLLYLENKEIVKDSKDKISSLEKENADILLDSAIKDATILALENDIADIVFEIAGGNK